MDAFVARVSIWKRMTLHKFHNVIIDFLHRLNPSGRDACPDCRTIIDDEADTKPVYPNYTSPDDLELTKLKKKNELLAHQMVLVKKENYNLKVKLGSEKEKNGRLQTRNEKIVNEMMAVLNNAQKLKVKTTCARCEANATKGKTIMKSKQQSKVCLLILLLFLPKNYF